MIGCHVLNCFRISSIDSVLPGWLTGLLSTLRLLGMLSLLQLLLYCDQLCIFCFELVKECSQLLLQVDPLFLNTGKP